MIAAEVFVRNPNEFEHDLGLFQFAILPRKGETLTVFHEGEELSLEVNEIRHRALNTPGLGVEGTSIFLFGTEL
jgi:hypothetical protein